MLEGSRRFSTLTEQSRPGRKMTPHGSRPYSAIEPIDLDRAPLAGVASSASGIDTGISTSNSQSLEQSQQSQPQFVSDEEQFPWFVEYLNCFYFSL